MKKIVRLSQDLKQLQSIRHIERCGRLQFQPVFNSRALSGQILLGQALWNLRGKKTWTSLSPTAILLGEFSEVGSEEEEEIKEIYKELGLQVLAVSQKS